MIHFAKEPYKSCYLCVTWFIDVMHVCDMTHLCHAYVWHDSFICVTWLIHAESTIFLLLRAVCDMTHSYVWHDSCICVTWLMHMCDMAHAYVWHDSFICATWLIHMCDMTHSYVWHDSFIHSQGVSYCYGVTTIGRLLKIIGLFCKRAIQKRQYSWLIHMCNSFIHSQGVS